jgi:hypothetical protein
MSEYRHDTSGNVLRTWRDGNLRFELRVQPDGEIDTVVYIRDATVGEAERAIRGAMQLKHYHLVFEGDMSQVEALASAHGIEVIP